MVQNNGLEFEYLVQAFFEERGVSVFETPGSNDYGADLVLYRNGKIAVIQCKCHSSPVGIHAVQEVTGAIKHYGADAGIVISNQPFTCQAVALAHSNHVLLIDGCMLQATMAGVSDEILFVDEFLAGLQKYSPVRQPVQPAVVCQVRRVKRPARVKLRRI